jgi:hypothetical protein
MLFLKMSAQVVKLVAQIQRDLLWGGVKGGRKISWKTSYMDKKDNVSLLAK